MSSTLVTVSAHTAIATAVVHATPQTSHFKTCITSVPWFIRIVMNCGVASAEIIPDCAPALKPGVFTSESSRSAVVRKMALRHARDELFQAGSTVDSSKEAKIRGLLTKALLSHAQTLCKSKHKLDLQQTVETAGKLFGWGAKDQGRALLQIGVVEKLDVKTPQ